jgi:hypothetical protein
VFFQANVECRGSQRVLARGKPSHAPNVHCSIPNPPSSTEYTPGIWQVKACILNYINISDIGYTSRGPATTIAWGIDVLASKDVSWCCDCWRFFKVLKTLTTLGTCIAENWTDTFIMYKAVQCFKAPCSPTQLEALGTPPDLIKYFQENSKFNRCFCRKKSGETFIPRTSRWSFESPPGSPRSFISDSGDDELWYPWLNKMASHHLLHSNKSPHTALY